ncbi:LacI family DNA-binding transcriptional regulator [Vibrio superstes]|uniref:LacI family transcriptional regulator n=1 Tax=Vibrio superstes NBRC 103154 TaxID=1219062 RepID=A0A511QP61_9VIBR|nr:LacI family DNA-binding transcriptional regulator [Vibrio superstes]GEM79115.1 LacI family transcriptional regulator [Vibrio superstes NBRC 103154]
MKKVTITDLAEMTGISRSTISRVLNNNPKVDPEVRKKVELAIEESGYLRKASKVKYEVPIRSVTIATTVLVDTPDPYYSIMINQFQEQFHQMGLQPQLILLNASMSEEQILDKLSDSECVLMLGPELPSIANALKDKDIPVVMVNGFDVDMRISSISLDYELGGELAAKYLIGNGHKNIAMLTAQTRPSIRKRTYGFQRAASELGAEKVTVIDILKYCQDTDQTAISESIKLGEAGADFGASKVLPQILDKGLFNGATAIFCLCDRAAISLLDELDKRGMSVPEDLSVMGFDNLSIGKMISPSLSSIGCDHRLTAQAAIQLLIQEFNENVNVAKRVNMGVKLFSRDSVKPL